MKKIFIVKYNDDTAFPGLVEKDAPPTFDALGGMGVAHDCLEHVNQDLGSIHNEFMALGAMLHIRFFGNYYSNRPFELKDIAVEIISILRYARDGKFVKLPMYPVTTTIKEIDEVLRLMKKQLWEDGCFDPDFYDKEEHEQRVLELLACARHYMTVGYRDAKQRIKNPSIVACCFRDIETKVENILRSAEIGEEVTISYTFTKYVAKVEHKDLYQMHPCR
jgi:hypothetical protein